VTFGSSQPRVMTRNGAYERPAIKIDIATFL
jgi:hypothetical protein